MIWTYVLKKISYILFLSLSLSLSLSTVLVVVRIFIDLVQQCCQLFLYSLILQSSVSGCSSSPKSLCFSSQFGFCAWVHGHASFGDVVRCGLRLKLQKRKKLDFLVATVLEMMTLGWWGLQGMGRVVCGISFGPLVVLWGVGCDDWVVIELCGLPRLGGFGCRW